MAHIDGIRKCAAQYLRKSTENQKYSTENQADMIAVYAASRNLEIVRTYEDAGRSGLKLDGRTALKQLLLDVQGGKAPFGSILVYDVSRWGRFQDADESAYYEYACKREGISVHYCAEQFDNDGTPLTTIIKGLKRAMAGEYSRELGVKVYAGQKRIIEQGFRLGALAGYGLRRQLVDPKGKPKQLLQIGERKSIQVDRVVLVPGPPDEVKIVKEIYRTFVRGGKAETQIASSLNRRGLRTNLGHLWSLHSVHTVLTSPKYIGHNIWNRTSTKLKQRLVRNPVGEWVRSPTDFEPIIEGRLFDKAQEIIRVRQLRTPDEELLVGLRKLLRKRGKVTARLIDAAEYLPSAAVIYRRFGGLVGAYRRIGFKPGKILELAELNQSLRALRTAIIDKTRTMLESRGEKLSPKSPRRNATLLLNGVTTIHFMIMKCRTNRSGNPRWRLGSHRSTVAGPALAVRMDRHNKVPAAMYFFAEIDLIEEQPNLSEKDLQSLEPHRIGSLAALYSLV